MNLDSPNRNEGEVEFREILDAPLSYGEVFNGDDSKRARSHRFVAIAWRCFGFHVVRSFPRKPSRPYESKPYESKTSALGQNPSIGRDFEEYGST